MTEQAAWIAVVEYVADEPECDRHPGEPLLCHKCIEEGGNQVPALCGRCGARVGLCCDCEKAHRREVRRLKRKIAVVARGARS